MNATISQDHTELTLLLPRAPTMGALIHLPLYGDATVIGLNDNYAGTGQTWLRLTFKDGRTGEFPYILTPKAT